jgi:hypothetical protein
VNTVPGFAASIAAARRSRSFNLFVSARDTVPHTRRRASLQTPEADRDVMMQVTPTALLQAPHPARCNTHHRRASFWHSTALVDTSRSSARCRAHAHRRG